MKKLWKWLRLAGIAKYLFLIFFPLFGRPRHFIEGVERRSYAFARFGLALPLAAGGIWALSIAMFLEALLLSNFEETSKLIGALEAHRRVTMIKSVSSWMTLIWVVMGIMILSAIRMGHHRLAQRVLRKFPPNGEAVPFRYFMTATSSTAFLYGLFALAISALQRYGSEHLKQIERLASSGPVLVLMLVFVVAHMKAVENSRKVRRDLYGPGWRHWLVLVADLLFLFGALKIIKWIV